MRTAILIGIRHDSGKAVLVSGPEIPYQEQSSILREALASGGVSDGFSELQFWTSDVGVERTVRFKTQEQADAHNEQVAKDTAAHNAHLKKLKEQQSAPPPAKTSIGPIPGEKTEAPANPPSNPDPVKTEAPAPSTPEKAPATVTESKPPVAAEAGGDWEQ